MELTCGRYSLFDDSENNGSWDLLHHVNLASIDESSLPPSERWSSGTHSLKHLSCPFAISKNQFQAASVEFLIEVNRYELEFGNNDQDTHK